MVQKTPPKLPKTNERRIYSDLFFETIMPYLNETYEKMFYKEFHIVNYWFQQYLKNDGDLVKGVRLENNVFLTETLVTHKNYLNKIVKNEIPNT